MNERIKELAEQARLLTGWPVGEVEFEKFAMSIIQECLCKVEEQYKSILEDEAMMKDTRWAYYVDCGVDSVVSIKEHFGVEE